jgi:predicted metal-dependent HD superfamily phosphohydrolase/dephospho-CoA kinase
MIAGVTGCVGAGKSTVCKLLAARGWHILEVDELVARLLEESGADKRVLFAEAMANSELRLQLTNELRPRVVRCIEEWAAQLNDDGAIECALLFELGLQSYCAATFCVTCSSTERRRRVELRTTGSAQHFDAIEAAQWSEAEKVARADVAFSTECPANELQERVAAAIETAEQVALRKPLYDDLCRRYAEPHRSYHTLEHVRACLRDLDRAGSPDAAIVEMALWYHDAIYDPRTHDNEERSAIFAEESMRANRLADELIRRVTRLIRATKTHNASVDRLAPLFVDIDLAILGAPPAQFAAYERGIRAEYHWVPEFIYRRERARVLRQFLAREPLFNTERLRAALEQRAKVNLRIAVDGLLF